MKAKIIVQLETSDHDGYCSGEECEYSTETMVKIIDVPNQFAGSILYGKIPDSQINKHNWIYHYLPEPQLNHSGSSYCNNSADAKINGLYKHDFKYTILSIEIFED